MTTRPGWYPDPSGRYPKRWYDGTDWTASVLDANGQQAYDQLPPAGAPSVATLPAASSPPPPPPPAPSAPPGGALAPTPSPWAPEAFPPAGGGSWQPGQPWQPASAPSAQPYTPMTSGGVWAPQQPVTTASLGLTPPPAVRTSAGTRTSPLAYGFVGIAIAALVLSMFVLDWYSEAGQSLGFRDFGEGSILSSAPLLDKVTFWNYQWLGFVVAGLALLSVFVFVVARAGSHRVGHVIAAIVATIGAVLSTFAIVRLFRTDEFDPDIGAWVLPAGYLVLLLAILISARNESA
jgi:hypothetical protein